MIDLQRRSPWMMEIQPRVAIAGKFLTITYRALHDRGVNVTFWAYPREPHGFQEPAHVEHFLELWASFFHQQLAAK